MVTGFVDENPECVLLFDEVEKSHPVTIRLFLQMLDSGRLRDTFTKKVVSFSRAIITSSGTSEVKWAVSIL